MFPDNLYLFNKQIIEYYNSVYYLLNGRGRFSDLERINADSLKEFYSANHNVDNLFIMVSGGLEKSVLLKLLKESGFDSVQAYGKRAKTVTYPYAPLKEMKFKTFHLEKDGLGHVKYSRKYLLPSSLDGEYIYSGTILAKMLDTFLILKVREELGSVYSIRVSTIEHSLLFDKHTSIEINTMFANYQQAQNIGEKIEAFVEGVFDLDESYFLEAKQILINEMFFDIPSVFTAEGYIRSCCISNEMSFVSTGKQLRFYQNIQWEDLKVFQKYLKPDQGISITEGLNSS